MAFVLQNTDSVGSFDVNPQGTSRPPVQVEVMSDHTDTEPPTVSVQQATAPVSTTPEAPTRGMMGLMGSTSDGYSDLDDIEARQQHRPLTSILKKKRVDTALIDAMANESKRSVGFNDVVSTREIPARTPESVNDFYPDPYSSRSSKTGGDGSDEDSDPDSGDDDDDDSPDDADDAEEDRDRGRRRRPKPSGTGTGGVLEPAESSPAQRPGAGTGLGLSFGRGTGEPLDPYQSQYDREAQEALRRLSLMNKFKRMRDRAPNGFTMDYTDEQLREMPMGKLLLVVKTLEYSDDSSFWVSRFRQGIVMVAFVVEISVKFVPGGFNMDGYKRQVELTLDQIEEPLYDLYDMYFCSVGGSVHPLVKISMTMATNLVIHLIHKNYQQSQSKLIDAIKSIGKAGVAKETAPTTTVSETVSQEPETAKPALPPSSKTVSPGPVGSLGSAWKKAAPPPTETPASMKVNEPTYVDGNSPPPKPFKSSIDFQALVEAQA